MELQLWFAPCGAEIARVLGGILRSRHWFGRGGRRAAGGLFSRRAVVGHVVARQPAGSGRLLSGRGRRLPCSLSIRESARSLPSSASLPAPGALPQRPPERSAGRSPP